jgi:hypothetical protein
MRFFVMRLFIFTYSFIYLFTYSFFGLLSRKCPDIYFFVGDNFVFLYSENLTVKNLQGVPLVVAGDLPLQ